MNELLQNIEYRNTILEAQKISDDLQIKILHKIIEIILRKNPNASYSDYWMQALEELKKEI